MKTATLALIAAALTSGFVDASLAQTVRFGTVAEFPPYNYLDSEGELRGLEADLGAAICERAALDCYWVLAPWPELISQLGDGEFDVIMSGLGITDARKLEIDFSTPYIAAGPSAVLALRGASDFAPGTTIGAQIDSLQAEKIRTSDWNLEEFDTPTAGIQAVLDQSISGFLADQAYVQSIIRQHPDTFTMVNSGLAIDGSLAIAAAKSSGLLPRLNSAITSLQADGTVNSLISKWFKDDNEKTRRLD